MAAAPSPGSGRGLVANGSSGSIALDSSDNAIDGLIDDRPCPPGAPRLPFLDELPNESKGRSVVKMPAGAPSGGIVLGFAPPRSPALLKGGPWPTTTTAPTTESSTKTSTAVPTMAAGAAQAAAATPTTTTETTAADFLLTHEQEELFHRFMDTLAAPGSSSTSTLLSHSTSSLADPLSSIFGTAASIRTQTLGKRRARSASPETDGNGASGILKMIHIAAVPASSASAAARAASARSGLQSVPALLPPPVPGYFELARRRQSIASFAAGADVTSAAAIDAGATDAASAASASAASAAYSVDRAAAGFVLQQPAAPTVATVAPERILASTMGTSSASSTIATSEKRRCSLDSDASASPHQAHGGSGKASTSSRDDKRVQHLATEQRRRQMMRDGYQRLCEIVPALRESTASASRKEAVILQKTVEYLRTLLIERYELGCEIEKLNGELGRPDDVIDSDLEDY